MRTPEKDRRDWIIVLVIILIGLILILLAGGCAVRLKPGWRLDSNMGSRIDPDSIFLTHRPNILFEPIDSSILTKPAWANDGLYVTPGAEIRTGTPVPAVVNNNTLPPPATITAVTTPTLVNAVTPTNTSGGLPPPASTRTPTPPPAGPTANLSITISDGGTTYIVGGTVTYTITAANPAGSANVSGAVVTDTFPAILSGITWTCTGLNGATCPANGSGNINDSVNLPAGSSVTFTITANISSAANSNLVNTATVSVPAGITDPSTTNNTATDTDTPVFRVDLQITKTDGIAVYTPGTSVTYTITVFNAGPANATGATVTDTFTFPALVGSTTWSCTASGGASCPAPNGSGNISQTVNIPRGGRLIYTAIVSTSPLAAVDLVNSASVGAPAGYTETVPGDNFDTDTDAVFIPTVNISINKTDGSLTYTPGTSLTYTITATNAGPDAATGITITDTFDTTRLNNIAWTCTGLNGATCTGSGSGNISDTVSLSATGTVIYTVSADVRSNATGDLANTAQVGIPANVNDTNPADNSYKDTDAPVYVSDLQLITNTDNATQYMAGAAKTYTITAFNGGPSDIIGARITSGLSSNADIDAASITWCSPGPAPSCTLSGSGDLNQSVDLTAGSSITFMVSAQVVASPAGPSISNTATTTAPVGVTDAAGNNSVTDTDDLMVPVSFPPDLGSGPAPTGDPYYNLPDGGVLTLLLPTPVIVGSHAGWDITYFEREIANNIFMDQVIIEIGDGSNWYIVLYWGDGFSDANTNIAIPLSGNSGGTCAGEPDNCVIDGPLLAVESGYITGITIDVDGVSPAIPNGTYNYLRIREPGLGSTDSINIDGIYIWP